MTGEPWTFCLRIDCEHVEAARWAGSAAVEARGLVAMLALLREAGVLATLAVVGLTAREYALPLRAAAGDGHTLIGHSHTHAQPYAGQPRATQRADMAAMVDAINGATGVHVRGLAPPCHGVVDGATLQAAQQVGLRYVLSMKVQGNVPAGVAVRVPPPDLRWIWDWTPLQPGWPPFSAGQAREEWRAAIDVAARDGGSVGLILHPWIMESNGVDVEAPIVHETVRYAAQQGARFHSFDDLAGEWTTLAG